MLFPFFIRQFVNVIGYSVSMHHTTFLVVVNL
jgi:hypothetical protein